MPFPKFWNENPSQISLLRGIQLEILSERISENNDANNENNNCNNEDEDLL